MATIIYEDFKFVYLFPADATDPSMPYGLLANTTYTLDCIIKDSSGTPKSVICKIGETTYTLKLRTLIFDPTPDTYEFELFLTWKSPSEGTVTFQWEARNSRDEKTITASSYGEVIAPEGYFSINGQKVGQDTTIYVYDPTVTFGFTATKDGNLITKVWVNVLNPDATQWTEDLEEKTENTFWEIKYTLPEYGVYYVYGYINIGEFTGYRLMSIVIPWNLTDSEDGGLWDSKGGDGLARPNQLTWLGLALVFVGTVMTFIGGRKK